MKRTLEPRLKRLETRLVSARPWHFIINMIDENGNIVETLCIDDAPTGVPQERER